MIVGRGERGSVPIELALGVGLLVLPVALLVAVLPGWAERTAMARVAAQQAARVAALAPSAEHGRQAGEAIVLRTAANHDVPAGDVLLADVAVPVDGEGAPLRGADVVVTVRVAIPVPPLPLGDPGRGLSRTATHRERIGDHRSVS